MKKLMYIVVALLLPVAASAQLSKDLTLYLSTGVSVPMSANDLAKNYQIDTVMNSFAVNYSSNGMLFSFADNWTAGFGLSGGVGYEITPELSLILNANYQTFKLDKATIVTAMGLPKASFVDDAELVAVTFSGNAKYQFLQFGTSFAPYLLGGVGLMTISADDIYVLVDTYSNLTYRFQSTNVLNASVGAGIDLLGGESSSMFLEAKVDMGFTDHGMMYFVPVRIGFRGSF